MDSELDMTPRYTPKTILTAKAGFGYSNYPVISVIAHPVGAHPAKCPLIEDCVALELISHYGSRWYGVKEAYINSELRMIVIGFNARFEEMQKWEKVPADRLK